MPNLSLFTARFWLGSFWWISTKLVTQAGACFPDIWWATQCKRHSSLMLNGSFGNHLVEQHNSQVPLNWKTLKYKFSNGMVYFANLPWRPMFWAVFKIIFPTSSFPKGDYIYALILSSFPCKTSICFVLDFKIFGKA